jgi:hypothetical protein
MAKRPQASFAGPIAVRLSTVTLRAQPLDNLAALAKAGVPLLHDCGGLDPMLDEQTRAAQKRYKELGGSITVIVQEGVGHCPTAPKDPKPVVAFNFGRRESKGTEPKATPPEGSQAGMDKRDPRTNAPAKIE